MRALATGARDLHRGLTVLRRAPRLWVWLVAPALATLALFAGAIAGIAWLVHPAVAWAVGHLPHALAGVAGTLLTVVIVALLGFAALVIFTAVAGAIAGPFNEMLSERVEARLRGSEPEPFALGRFVHELGLGIVHAIRRIIIAVVAAIVVLLIGLVPVVGAPVALVLGFVFAARGAAYDCYDAVLARRALAYSDKLAFLARHRGRTFGLGAAVAALLLVPGVNLVALGLGAAAATVAAHELESAS